MTEKNDKEIFLVAQKDANVDEPGKADIYDFGTVANILQLLKLPDGTVIVFVDSSDAKRMCVSDSTFLQNNLNCKSTDNISACSALLRGKLILIWY